MAELSAEAMAAYLVAKSVVKTVALKVAWMADH
jgi:hypothetical protein